MDARWRTIIPLDVALGSGVCIDHHPTGATSLLHQRWDESNPINVGCIRNYYSPGPPSVDEKERAGPTRHASSRANSVLLSLFSRWWSGQKAREREREREREQKKIETERFHPIFTWLPSVRLTVDQSIYAGWTLGTSPPLSLSLSFRLVPLSPRPFTPSSPSGCP